MLRPRRAMLPMFVIWLGGCTVGPDYEPPTVEVMDEWEAAVDDELSQETPDIELWWENLGDTLLTDLIKQAELTSLDLQIAVGRVVESRAARGIAKSALYPDLVLEGAYSYTRVSENSPAGQIIVGSGATVEPQSQYQYTGSTFWEIDLWGRIRRGVESATAAFEADIENYRDVQVTLYAEVAANYADIRSLQARLDFAVQNADAQRESLGLTQDRFDAGLTSALDVAQAEQNLAQTESTIPQLEAQLNAALNRIAVLLGFQPGALDDRLDSRLGIPNADSDIVTGVPADIVRRRPDVRRAERLLASQTALIGVAKADLYPSFSISGFIEGVTGSIGTLFTGQSTGWGIVPGFRWDIFSGGRVQNNIQVQEARTYQLLIGYQQTVLLALEEVESSLVAYQREIERRERLRDAANASQRAVDLVRTQYISGLTNFQNLLDTQRSLFQQQDLLAQSEGQVVLNLIFLNRALGGGWSMDASVPQEIVDDDETTRGSNPQGGSN